MNDEAILNLFETNGKIFFRFEDGVTTWWSVVLKPEGFRVEAGECFSLSMWKLDNESDDFYAEAANRIGSIYEVQCMLWNKLY